MFNIHLTELSSQAEDIFPQDPPPFQPIRYFEQPSGILQDLKPEHAQDLVYDTHFVFGLDLNGFIHPLCDADGRRVVRRRSDGQTIPLPPQVAENCGFNRPPWNRRLNSRASSSSSRSEHRPTHF